MARELTTTTAEALASLKATASRIGLRAAIKAARTPAPHPDVNGSPVRRFVSIACTAEVQHAEAEFARIVSDLGVAACFDPRNEPAAAAGFYLPHEAAAAAALVWLSHLQAHDSARHGTWSRWAIMSRDDKAAWLQRRRYLLRGLVSMANGYRALRASLA